MGPVTRERSHPLFFTYSLMLATFLGTMGLPHILVRFYTNPDGHSARRTTLIVLGLLSVFYLFPVAFGLAALVIVTWLVTGPMRSETTTEYSPSSSNCTFVTVRQEAVAPERPGVRFHILFEGTTDHAISARVER